jgi:aminoglycoside 6'-N-acetyltransferase
VATVTESPASGPAPPTERASLTWRRTLPADFGLLATWLAAPHVARWWCHEWTSSALERDFGPATRGEEPGADLLVHLDGRPVGLVQRCRFDDYPGYRDELRTAGVDVPTGALTVDYLVGDPVDTGRGLGAQILRAVVEASWTDHPDAPAVIVPVAVGNTASWRALEKAGLRRVAEVDLTPDNPLDPPAHVVHRVDRPHGGTGGGS